jgi:hypothetical protein
MRPSSPRIRLTATSMKTAFRTIWLKLDSGKWRDGKGFSHAIASNTG